MKNILVTGCAGFIGSHTVDALLAVGHNIVGVDCLTYAASKENMNSFINEIEFYEVDIVNKEKMSRIVEKHNIDWIINFAAETHVDNSINSAAPFLHSNINGVYSLLEVCRQFDCRFFQISTDEVYGSTRDGSFVETDKLNPRNPYAATKAAAEHLVTSFFNTYGLEYKIVRMSNNFGPRQHREKFIPTILRSLKNNQKIPIYGDGKNIRDWFYVKDCAKSIVEVLNNGKINEAYNLSLQNEMENIEIVGLILDVLELPFEENTTFVEDRLGHDFRYSIDNKKLLNLKKQKPTNFKQCLLETIRSSGAS